MQAWRCPLKGALVKVRRSGQDGACFGRVGFGLAVVLRRGLAWWRAASWGGQNKRSSFWVAFSTLGSLMKIKLEGFSDLDKALAELSRAAGKSVLRRSLKKAATPMAELASGLAPRDSGDLSESFVYSTKLTKRQAALHRKMFRDDRASVEGYVGSNDPAAVQQEFGNINHGPQPALRPAWDQDAMPLLDRLGKELALEVEKSVKRARAKAARR